MSDTPRTGALLESILRRDRFLSDKNAPEEWVVHARQLERQLAAANRKIQLLVEAGDVLDKVADAADDDIREHLQVANYNLHGLLNTGERIQPPNPPQTIHQAGINASVAVRDEIRKARARWTAAKEEIQ